LSEDEGAEIYIGQGQLAGTIGRGKLVIGVPAGGTLEVEKRKNGYHPDREDFQLADQPVEIPLSPLRKIIRFGFELFSLPPSSWVSAQVFAGMSSPTT
jgi:hypothetical protein